MTTSTNIHLDHELTKGFAIRYIRRVAARVVGKAGLGTLSQDDIQQSLVVRLLERLPAFDGNPDRWHGFVAVVVKGAVANLLRNARATKRCERNFQSLSDQVHGEDGKQASFGHLLTEEEGLRRLGLEPSDQFAAVDERLDMETFLARLPAELRDVCERLAHHSTVEVASQLKIPRSTLNRWLADIRERYRQFCSQES